MLKNVTVERQRIQLSQAKYNQLVRLVESDKKGGKPTQKLTIAEYTEQCSHVLGYPISIYTVKKVAKEHLLPLKWAQWVERVKPAKKPRVSRASVRGNGEDLTADRLNIKVLRSNVRVLQKKVTVLEQVIQHLCTDLGESFEKLCHQLTD